MELRDLKKLKMLMELNGLSVRDLAKIAGYESHTHLARVLRGEYKTLPTDRALRIVAHFKQGVDDLFFVRVSNDTGQNDRSDAA